MSLAHWLEVDPASLPGPVPYLTPPRALARPWVTPWIGLERGADLGRQDGAA